MIEGIQFLQNQFKQNYFDHYFWIDDLILFTLILNSLASMFLTPLFHKSFTSVLTKLTASQYLGPCLFFKVYFIIMLLYIIFSIWVYSLWNLQSVLHFLIYLLSSLKQWFFFHLLMQVTFQKSALLYPLLSVLMLVFIFLISGLR